MRYLYWIIGVCALIIPLQTIHADLRIHAVMIDPLGIDSGKEWIRLKNTGTGSILLDHWILDPSNLPDVSFPTGTTLLPGEVLSIYFRSPHTPTSHELHLSDEFSTQNMANNAGFIALYQEPTKSATTIVDYLAYGAPNQSFLNLALAREIWQAEWFFPIHEGHVLERISPEHTLAAWTSYALPTEPEHPSPPIGSGSTINDEPPTGSGDTLTDPPETDPETTFTPANQNPIPIITIQGNKQHSGYAPFSFNVTGEESYDPDNHSFTYFWDFGNGETSTRSNPLATTYTTPGTYTVLLTLTDTQGAQTTTSLLVTVTEKPSAPPKTTSSTSASTASTTSSTTLPNCTPQNTKAPLISEILPNPEGDDTDHEWIELYNPHDTTISLCHWSITDIEGRPTTYIFSEILLTARSFFILESSLSRISLNNAKETIILYNPNEEVVEEVSYINAPSGKSYSRLLP